MRLGTVFSGIGAIEHALERMGIDYEVAFACDNSNLDWAEKVTSLKKLQDLLAKLDDSGASFEGLHKLNCCWMGECSQDEELSLQGIKPQTALKMKRISLNFPTHHWFVNSTMHY